MANDLSPDETRGSGPRTWRYLLPVGILIVVVAIICGLVLSGVVVGDRETQREAPMTTAPTVEIAP